MFGKPKQDDTEMRCINCGETFEDREADLHHAGRTEDGDFWNTECPECGTYDMMNEEYADMSEQEFRNLQREYAQSAYDAKKRQRKKVNQK